MEVKHETAIDQIDYQYKNNMPNNIVIFKVKIADFGKSKLIIRGELYSPPLKEYPSQKISDFVSLTANYKRELGKIEKLSIISLEVYLKKYPFRTGRKYSERAPLSKNVDQVRKLLSTSSTGKTSEIEVTTGSVKPILTKVNKIEVTPQIITNLCITEEYSITVSDKITLYAVEKVAIPIGDSYYYKIEVPSIVLIEEDNKPARASDFSLMLEEFTSSTSFKRDNLLKFYNNKNLRVHRVPQKFNKCPPCLRCDKSFSEILKKSPICRKPLRRFSKNKENGLVSEPVYTALQCLNKIIFEHRQKTSINSLQILRYLFLSPRKRLNIKKFRKKRIKIYVTTSKEYGK